MTIEDEEMLIIDDRHSLVVNSLQEMLTGCKSELQCFKAAWTIYEFDLGELYNANN
jgi:hypothetical protein